VAPGSGAYTLALAHTDHCRLYLDGVPVIDHSTPAPLHLGHFEALTGSVTVDLHAGDIHDLRVEFTKTTDEWFAMIRLCLGPAPRVDATTRMARAVELARSADVAIVFAGLPELYESEGRDRPDWELPGPQAELIRAVAQANPKTVVVLNGGAPMAMPWLGDVPALLKAFLEQVMRPGFALEYRTTGLPLKLLQGRSARVVVTMGMPALFYRLVYSANSLKSLERNILKLVGFKPVEHTIVGNVQDAKRREQGLAEMRELGAKAT